MVDPPRALSLDLDDTLCVYRRPGEAVLEVAFERAGVEPFFEYADYAAVFDDHVDGSDSMADLRERCFVALARERGHDPDAGRAVAYAYTAERDGANVRALPGARAVVRDHDGPVGLVTNGPRELQTAKLDRLGLTDAFDAVVYAGDEVPAKPDPAPFDRLLDALDASPREAAHVGNSLRTDVTGANAAGLASVWLAPDGTSDPPADHRIASLRDLPW